MKNLSGIIILLGLFVSCGRNEIDGTYKIISAHSHLYHHLPYDENGVDYTTEEIETEKRGDLITINRNSAMFDNSTYRTIDGYKWNPNRDFILDYDEFLMSFAGLNYGTFDINIIGKDYEGKVRVMTMKNDIHDHHIFFADNKLIIAMSTSDYKGEFEHLIVYEGGDIFFYVAEKISK